MPKSKTRAKKGRPVTSVMGKRPLKRGDVADTLPTDRPPNTEEICSSLLSEVAAVLLAGVQRYDHYISTRAVDHDYAEVRNLLEVSALALVSAHDKVNGGTALVDLVAGETAILDTHK